MESSDSCSWREASWVLSFGGINTRCKGWRPDNDLTIFRIGPLFALYLLTPASVKFETINLCSKLAINSRKSHTSRSTVVSNTDFHSTKASTALRSQGCCPISPTTQSKTQSFKSDAANLRQVALPFEDRVA